MKVWTTLTRRLLLHDAWHLDNYTGLISAMVTAAVLSVIFEFLGVIKRRCVDACWKNKRIPQNTKYPPSPILKRLTESIFYIISVTVSYILMLCVMTMNVWILLTILFGTAAGHFLQRTMKKQLTRPDLEIHEIGDTHLGEKINRKNCEPLLNEEKELSEQCETKQFLDCNDERYT